MNIRGLKIKILVKILLLVIFVVVTGIYWDNLEINKYATLVKNNSYGRKVDFDVESDYGFVLNLLDDKTGNDSKFKLNITNETTGSGYYEIALMLNKECDFSKLYLAVDNDLHNLNDLYIDSDNEYNYFIIASNVIDDQKVSYNLGLYINDCDIDYFNNNNVELNFIDFGVNKI